MDSPIIYDAMDFPKMFQLELLRHMYMDESLYADAASFVRPVDFDLPACQVIFDALRSYRKRFGTNPPVASLKIEAIYCAENGGAETAPLATEDLPAFAETWMSFEVALKRELDTQLYRSRLITWVKRVRYNKMLQMSNLSQQSIDAMIQQTKALDDLAMEDDDDEFVDGWKDVQPVDTSATSRRITTGLLKLDRHTNGGLGIGEIGAVMACPGVGKTTALINFSVAASCMGYRVLFLTFEMMRDRIVRRQMAITAHIHSRLFLGSATAWDQYAIDRRHAAKNYAPVDGVIVKDFSNKKYTILQISNTIKRWKKQMYARHGTEEANPLMVCVDWIHPDYIELPDKRDVKDHVYMASIAKTLGQVGKDTDVAMWTAFQANKGGDGKETLRMRDTAGAYDMNQAFDLAVALAPMRDYAKRQETLINDDEEGTAAVNLVTDDGRRLSINSTKTRDTTEFRFEVFQSPTMRFWDSKERWMHVARRLNGPDSARVVMEDLGVFL